MHIYAQKFSMIGDVLNNNIYFYEFGRYSQKNNIEAFSAQPL